MKKLMLFLFGMLFCLMIIQSVSAITSYNCYQETVNVSTSCGGLDNGNYSFSVSWVSPTAQHSALVDGNWSSYSNTNSANSQLIPIYGKPANATNNSIFQIKLGTELTPITINYSIPSSCWNRNESFLNFYVDSSGAGEAIIMCLNRTGYQPFNGTGFISGYGQQIYEEAMIWQINNQYVYNSESYNNFTSEGATESFSINISYNSNYFNSVSANFIYNGTSYLGTAVTSGQDTIINATIPIPLIIADNENQSFYWQIALSNSSTIVYYNSSLVNQSISKITFAQCSASVNIPIVNFTIYNETSNELINSTFKAYFEYSAGSSTNKKNLTANIASNHSFQFCTNGNTTFTVSSIIDLTSSGMSDKSYNLVNKIYNRNTTDEKLYMISSDDTISRVIIIQVQDKGYSPLKGYIVKVFKLYPDLGTYVKVSEDVSDVYGQVPTSITENSGKYKIEIYNPSGVLVKASDAMTISCRSSIYLTTCVLPFIITEYTTAFNDFENVTSYTYSLTFNNNTNIFLFTWNDNTGSYPLHRLYVVKSMINGTSGIVCNSTSTALIGSLSCSVGSSRASYTADAYRELSDIERRIATISTKVGSLARNMGLDGLMWSFIILLTMVAIGRWYPPIGIGLYLFAFLILGLLDIIYVSPAILFAEFAIGIAFIWAFRS